MPVPVLVVFTYGRRPAIFMALNEHEAVPTQYITNVMSNMSLPTSPTKMPKTARLVDENRSAVYERRSNKTVTTLVCKYELMQYRIN